MAPACPRVRSLASQVSPLAWLVAVHAGISVVGWTHAMRVAPTTDIWLTAGQFADLLLASLALAQLLIMSRAPWLEQVHGLDGLARVHHRIGAVYRVGRPLARQPPASFPSDSPCMSNSKPHRRSAHPGVHRPHSVVVGGMYKRSDDSECGGP